MHASGGSCSAGAGRDTMGGTREARVKAFGVNDYTLVMLRKEDGFTRYPDSRSAGTPGWERASNSNYDDVPMQEVSLDREYRA